MSRLKSNSCVPFLGAGASVGASSDIGSEADDSGETGPRPLVGEHGVPIANELAAELLRIAEEAGFTYHGPADDFFSVCNFMELVYGEESFVREFITSIIKESTQEPTKVHKNLAALPITDVLTTNFDDLMERAFEEGQPQRQPQVAYYDRNSIGKLKSPNGTSEQPLIYKLHGSIADPLSLICTEDDLAGFLAGLVNGHPELPDHINHLFQQNTLLFIGYGLKDWNIRVLLKAIGNTRKLSFSIQFSPVATAVGQWAENVMFWEKKFGLKCFNMDATQFTDELVDRWRRHSGSH